MSNNYDELTVAVSHHQAGRFAEAEQIYRRVLTVEPDNADAWHLLGVIYLQRQSPQLASQYISHAIALDPSVADFHNNLGNANKDQQKWPEALANYRKALDLNPRFPEVLHNLGTVLRVVGQGSEAIDCYRSAVELRPDFADAYFSLGNALRDYQQWSEAAQAYRQAAALSPQRAEVHARLGQVLVAEGRFVEASGALRQAIALRSSDAEVHNQLGYALQQQGETGQAHDCYRSALELQPTLAEAWLNLGIVQDLLGKPESAIASYRRVLELDPTRAVAHFNWGKVALDLDRADEAKACFRRAIEIQPDLYAAAGALMFELQHECEWAEMAALSRQILAGVDSSPDQGVFAPLPPFNLIVLPTPASPRQLLKCARQWVDRHAKLTGQVLHRSTPTSATAKDRITVGYYSADFCDHATAHLIAELFEKHDRRKFRVHAYSYGVDDGSPLRARLVAGVDRFVELRTVPHFAAAEKIASDGVDVLVDLKGYTLGARTEVLALRPAPIQVNYLGFPGTMGAPFIDYILVDDFIVPPAQQPNFSEQLVHLPGCYQVNDSQRTIAKHVPARASLGLPTDGFVFCSFNSNYKITAGMFDIWMRLLRDLPGSVLWLLAGRTVAQDNLRREAAVRDISPERLVFAAREPLPLHLARHQAADLFLDTFPVNAHTTASDALWAGLPVLTLAGETLVSRVAGSLLNSLGLPELITHTVDDYYEMALRLATHPALLASLRERLLANRTTSGVFDAAVFAQSLEHAYMRIWKRYCDGQPPRPIRVTRD